MSPVISLRHPEPPPPEVRTGPALVLQDPCLRDGLDQARRATDMGLPLLLAGESGTGKEYLAREIHRRSERPGPFVAVNCAALPEALAFAELFGHADGAYTGARRGGAEGRIAEAERGTLLLDEIGDMPLSLQVTLLRFLDDFHIRPLGQSRERRIDVQVIAATNVNLKDAVAQGRFRKDLLYRINTIEIRVPPLRERLDFDAIVRSLWSGIPQAPALTPSALLRLRHHGWDGNMRELKGILYRLAFRHPQGPITAEQVARELPTDSAHPPTAAAVPGNINDLLRETLAESRGNVSEAARRLGLSRTSFYRYMARMASRG